MLALRRCLFTLPNRFYSSACALEQCLKREGIICDVIDGAPNEVLAAYYPSGVAVEMGNELTPTQVKDRPCVKWKADNCKFYLLCMTDPDAPSRDCPKLREWQHWLVGNIPGCKVTQGETLSEYIGAAPPKGTCLHRYVLMVYQQREKICFSDVPRLTSCSAMGRSNFSIKTFAAKYQMCNPIAVNFFKAQFDCYVPVLSAQIGLA